MRSCHAPWWTIVGSLNGGEVSAQLNPEMALLVGSDEA
jgi:hypothetical protein